MPSAAAETHEAHHKSHSRHSRESGNPCALMQKRKMDSRFRGNDDLEVLWQSLKFLGGQQCAKAGMTAMRLISSRREGRRKHSPTSNVAPQLECFLFEK